MKAFYWMMAKTMTIPETGSYYFPDNSQAMPSTNRQFHTLAIIVAIYHIIKSKRYSNIILSIYYNLFTETRMYQFLLQISQEYATKLGNTSILPNIGQKLQIFFALRNFFKIHIISKINIGYHIIIFRQEKHRNKL